MANLILVSPQFATFLKRNSDNPMEEAVKWLLYGTMKGILFWGAQAVVATAKPDESHWEGVRNVAVARKQIKS